MEASRKERDQNVRRRESRKGEEIQGDGARGKELSGTCSGPQVDDAVRLWKVSHRSLSLSLAPLLHFSHSPKNEDAARIRRSTFLPRDSFLNRNFQTFLASFPISCAT